MTYDTPYIIGVIRNRERTLLGTDEYTRLIEAPTASEAVRALNDTSYGKWFEDSADSAAALAALETHLVDTQQWLLALLAPGSTRQFMQTRYDGLAMADALLAYHAGAQGPANVSPLGSLTEHVLYEVVWKGTAEPDLKSPWRQLAADWRDTAVTRQDRWQTRLVRDIQRTVTSILSQAASTPLQHHLVQLHADQTVVDSLLRLGEVVIVPQASPAIAALTPEASTAVIVTALADAGYSGFTAEIVAELKDRINAIAYERTWDEALMSLLRPHAFDVSGEDAVLTYWHVTELEVKTLRLVLSAKMQGIDPAEIVPLKRSLFRERV